ncbi:MAG: hypothetical protein KIS96_01115 [Bauldia sp.]|nr:hypothetical protein [Bauldia sp.]
MSPMNIVFVVAQFVRWGAWAMAVLFAALAVVILSSGADNYPTAPDQQEAGLIALAWAIGLVVLAVVMGPVVRQLSDARRF